MEAYLKTSLWGEFGPVIDYLADTIAACPDRLWHAGLYDHPNAPPEIAQFWYRAYHTLFWLDLYLTGTEEGYLPPSPFELIEQEEFGPIPQRHYTQSELLAFLADTRARCKATIAALTDEKAQRQCAFGWGEVSFFELMIYNLRHVQEHTGQMNLFLGQNGIETPDYITQLRNDPL